MSKKHKHISATKTTEQKAVQQSQQPQELTPQKLNRLLEKNPFAQLLGMELLEVREGYAYGRMRMEVWFAVARGEGEEACITVECMADVRMRLLIRLLVWRHPPMAIMLQRLTGK